MYTDMLASRAVTNVIACYRTIVWLVLQQSDSECGCDVDIV